MGSFNLELIFERSEGGTAKAHSHFGLARIRPLKPPCRKIVASRALPIGPLQICGDRSAFRCHPHMHRRDELAGFGFADVDTLRGHTLAACEMKSGADKRHAPESVPLECLAGGGVHDSRVDAHAICTAEGFGARPCRATICPQFSQSATRARIRRHRDQRRGQKANIRSKQTEPAVAKTRTISTSSRLAETCARMACLIEMVQVLLRFPPIPVQKSNHGPPWP